MLKVKTFLSVAALALVGAVMTGCSGSDDDGMFDTPLQPANTGKTVTMKTTVGLGDAMDGGDDTRALTIDDETHKGVKTFAEGETMVLIYKNTSGGTVTAVSEALAVGDIAADGKSADFTFTLTDTDIDKSQAVTYVYPAAMANTDGTVNYGALATQDGTLNTLASTLDYCTNSGAWTKNGNLPSLTLVNQLAILAVTLKNGDSDITGTVTGMTVGDGSHSYAVSRSATAGPIYVAIRPTSSATINITATDGTKDYTKKLTGKTYAAGNGYSVSWRMAEVVPPATGHALSSSVVGEIICSDGKAYAGSDHNNLPSGVKAVAKVCYVSDGKGLALALRDWGNMSWDTAMHNLTYNPPTPSVPGCKWTLATKTEWNNMISAAGGYAALRDGFSNVGGYNMRSDYYLSSSEKDDDEMWCYDFLTASWKGGVKGSYSTFYVRACLKF